MADLYQIGRDKWRRSKHHVTMTCPDCGTIGILQEGSPDDHGIDPTGKVSPSVACPTDGCNFHEFVRLAGWTEEGSTR